MKKSIIVFLVIMVLAVVGCNNEQTVNSKENDHEVEIIKDVKETQVVEEARKSEETEKVQEVEELNEVEEIEKTQEIRKNPYFFNETYDAIECEGEFLYEVDREREKVTVRIDKIKELQKGTLYELRIENCTKIRDGRFSLGYFYVEADRIYELGGGKEEMERFIEDNILPERTDISCQEQPLDDPLLEDEKGWHHYLTIDGDQIQSHSYNSLVDTGYYETITWQRGRGIVEYRSGYGAERDDIHLFFNYPEDRVINETYTNERLGFELDIPKAWEGKYTIEEEDHVVRFRHKVEDEEGMILYYIFVFSSEQQWEEEEGLNGLELGRGNGKIYIKRIAGDYPYDFLSEEGLNKIREVDRLSEYMDFEKNFRIISK